MRLSYWILFIALLLSTIAAYYSIQGLVTMFAGAAIPVIVMSSVMETAKVSITVWLHRYWTKVKLPMKCYLVPAVVILMVITSTGIFGLLARAHSDQSATNGDIGAKVAILDEKIRTERENIDQARSALAQMNASVDQTLARSTTEGGASRSAQIRKSQAKERQTIQNEITKAQERIVKLNDERAPIASQLRRAEAEVGPIKYVAAMIYGDNPDITMLERAVRWLIILLVIVFDPLAIFMVLAANESMKWEKEKKATLNTNTVADFLDSETAQLDLLTSRVGTVEGRLDNIVTTLEADIELLSKKYSIPSKDLGIIEESVMIIPSDEPEEQDVLEIPSEELTEFNSFVPAPAKNARTVEVQYIHKGQGIPLSIPDDEPEIIDVPQSVEESETIVDLIKEWREEPIETFEEVIEEQRQWIEEVVTEVQPTRKPDHVWKLLNPGKTLKEQRRHLEHGIITELPWENQEFVQNVQNGVYDYLEKDK